MPTGPPFSSSVAEVWTSYVVEAMAGASGRAVTTLRVDGGASVMDLLLQIQDLGFYIREPIIVVLDKVFEFIVHRDHP